MGEALPHITAAELRVMKVLWRLGSGTVRQVLNALPADSSGPPAYTTVLTAMRLLAEKGALTVDRERQPFVYAPAVREERVLRSRLAQFVQNVFDGQAEDLVLHLVEYADLSPEELRRIEEKIRARARAEGPTGRREDETRESER
jgi:predicted transcriptional regulator